jgi:hypothetical protein
LSPAIHDAGGGLTAGASVSLKRAMTLRNRWLPVVAFCALHVWLTGVARAQNLPSMVIDPWQEGRHWAESVDDMLNFDKGHTRGSNLDTGMFYWDSYGRVRFNRAESDPTWIVGYQVLTISEESESAEINGDYWDLAATLGHKFAEWDNGWRLSVIGGAGTANDSHFGDTDAIYGIGILNLVNQLDESTSLNCGVMYDGNRSVCPDIPMPFVAYRHKVSEKFSFKLGFPANGFEWRPFRPLGLEVNCVLPAEAQATLSLWLSKVVCLFAEFDSTSDGFWINDTDDRRIFYSNSRAATGLRWFTKWADARFGVGYAFWQSFKRGFDLRDTHTIEKLSDEPYLTLLIHSAF